METLVKSNIKGQNVTTSLIIADIFGKEHNKVCRDIESLDCPEDFNAANFGVISFKDSMNREQRAYEITKDGFSFLVMGYTGAKAAKFKVDFINEFNKRENMLKSDEYILMRSQQILQNNFKALEMDLYRHKEIIEVQDKEIKELVPKAEYTDKVLQSKNAFTVTQVAKELDMSAEKLNKILAEKKIQFKQRDQWLLYADYSGKGYTHTDTWSKNVNGEERTYHNTVWTEKGRKFIHDILNSK